MTTSFFLIFSEHPWDKLRINHPHLQFLMNNYLYSSHTDIKVCTYYLYTHASVLIHEILYLANQVWCIDFLTLPTPLIIPHRLPAFLESLMHSKTDARFMQHGRKAVWSIPYVSVAFVPSLKQNFIAYHSSKVISRPDCIFEIHQLWQSDFNRVYSNCCCSCSFEPEIIKIGQSSYKMYSNNIVNFQESTTILNAYTKKVRKLIEGIIYWYCFFLFWLLQSISFFRKSFASYKVENCGMIICGAAWVFNRKANNITTWYKNGSWICRVLLPLIIL